MVSPFIFRSRNRSTSNRKDRIFAYGFKGSTLNTFNGNKPVHHCPGFVAGQQNAGSIYAIPTMSFTVNVSNRKRPIDSHFTLFPLNGNACGGVSLRCDPVNIHAAFDGYPGIGSLDINTVRTSGIRIAGAHGQFFVLSRID